MKRPDHADSEEDKKMFGKMLKKAMKPHKIERHLQRDIKEQKKGISEDRKLMKSIRGVKRGR